MIYILSKLYKFSIFFIIKKYCQYWHHTTPEAVYIEWRSLHCIAYHGFQNISPLVAACYSSAGHIVSYFGYS